MSNVWARPVALHTQSALFRSAYVDMGLMTRTNNTPLPFSDSNRHHTVDEQTGNFLYELYLLLRGASLSDWAKQRAFEAAADCSDSWRVLWISRKALERVVEADGKPANLRRAHWYARKDRFAEMFRLDKPPMAKRDLLEYFFKHDTCALVTAEENNQAGWEHWSLPLINVPEGIFTSGGFSVYVRRTVDLPWAKQTLLGQSGD